MDGGTDCAQHNLYIYIYLYPIVTCENIPQSTIFSLHLLCNFKILSLWRQYFCVCVFVQFYSRWGLMMMNIRLASADWTLDSTRSLISWRSCTSCWSTVTFCGFGLHCCLLCGTIDWYHTFYWICIEIVNLKQKYKYLLSSHKPIKYLSLSLCETPTYNSLAPPAKRGRRLVHVRALHAHLCMRRLHVHKNKCTMTQPSSPVW